MFLERFPSLSHRVPPQSKQLSGARLHLLLLLTCTLLGAASTLPAASANPSAEQVEFFEKRIRPVLAQDCYECHSSTGKRKGGLALDHREALLQGGDSGPAIVLGDPSSSLLVHAIRHENETLQMPKAGAKLEPEVIADFEAWIARGAPDPRDGPPDEAALAADTDWDAVMERRKRWWSFQPLRHTDLEDLPGDADDHPVDRFIRAGLNGAGLETAGPADPATLLRRLSFVLRGLPPLPAEVEAFCAEPTAKSYDAFVSKFLDSPRFGERWARHWMDWFRYAESHGSEGDPGIPYAWQYRDYLIRALNDDVPFDQLAREHLAGDLLKRPRINPDLGLNESALGTSHLRMVFHGFAPTDALDEQVRFTDDQIDVVSKAFLGLTVSCARCHNHKFDPISQKDFYAWYGIFASSPPGVIAVDAPDVEMEGRRQRMITLKQSVRETLATHWTESLPGLEAAWAEDSSAFEATLREALALPADGSSVQKILQEQGERPETESSVSAVTGEAWDLGDPAVSKTWFLRGNGTTPTSTSGEFALEIEGDNILKAIYPSGIYTHLLSDKDRGVLLSPRIHLKEERDLWLWVAGDGGAFMRYAVQGYPRNGTVYPVGRLNTGAWQWQRYPLDYWTGDDIHVEFTTAADQPVLADTGATRSWFGVRKVVLTRPGEAPPERGIQEAVRPLAEALKHVSGSDRLIAVYGDTLRASIEAWRERTLTDEQALFLNASLTAGLLPNQMEKLPSIRSLVETYRREEALLPVPTRAPGVWEKDARDQPLLDRGNHKQPLQPVPRHFLDAIDGAPYETRDSGRLNLAEDLFRPDNPLTRRVAVNRIWHHVFGEGLVRTPDNLGRLGEKPTHPRLLDHLGLWFEENGFSIKELIRHLVSSETFKTSSTPSELAMAIDPDNRLLSHAPVRRLEAEAIRDALLAVSGKLKENAMHGPPVGGQAPRRSVYVGVRRNDLDPFLSTFDAPVPASTKGRRDVTNVPGQSLTLLNDSFVMDQARAFGERILEMPEGVRLDQLFLRALGRDPSSEERQQALVFLGEAASQRKSSETERKRLAGALETSKTRRAHLRNAVTERVRGQRASNDNSAQTSSLPKPLALWEFDEDFTDEAGIMDATAHGNARLEDGHLVLDGQPGSHVSTGPLPIPLQEKTLEAWVRLENLHQRGGGVISVQDLRGSVFDALVFGEQETGHWLAGSDTFARTQSLAGPAEEEAAESFVHVALVYSADGTITAYRQGQLHGKPYRSQGPVHFEAGKTQVLFGNRHGEPDGNRLLAGRIDRAALYDRALNPEEIAASASGDPSYVSRAEFEEALEPTEKEELGRLESEIAVMAPRVQALEKGELQIPDPWTSLAHAIFNVKEFIYLP